MLAFTTKLVVECKTCWRKHKKKTIFEN